MSFLKIAVMKIGTQEKTIGTINQFEPEPYSVLVAVNPAPYCQTVP
jgi:hypothetical protein